MSDELLDSIDEVIEAPTHEPEAPVADVEGKEPEVEAKKEPEATKEPAKEPEKKAEPKTIPLASHLEERRKLETRLEQEAAARKALEERLAKLENPPKAPEPDPDYQEDPKAYVDHRVQNALKALEETTGKKVEEVGKTAEQAAKEAQFNRFMTELQSTEAQFLQATPDYYDALAHIRGIRISQLKVFNPEITQEQINQTIVREEMALAGQLMQQGKNPHQYAYEIAKTYGYQKKEPTKDKLELPEVKGPKQLPPDQTLGSGSAPAGDGEEGEGDEFDDAFKAMFKPRKRA